MKTAFFTILFTIMSILAIAQNSNQDIIKENLGKKNIVLLKESSDKNYNDIKSQLALITSVGEFNDLIVLKAATIATLDISQQAKILDLLSQLQIKDIHVYADNEIDSRTKYNELMFNIPITGQKAKN